MNKLESLPTSKSLRVVLGIYVYNLTQSTNGLDNLLLNDPRKDLERAREIAKLMQTVSAKTMQHNLSFTKYEELVEEAFGLFEQANGVLSVGGI
jgi:hypothetical protein